MHKLAISVLLTTCALCHLTGLDPQLVAAERALEFAELFGSKSSEPDWKERYLVDYWHPQANESGLPGRQPSFMPRLGTDPGDYLYTSVRVGSVRLGRTPWMLGGSQDVVMVELLFLAVAAVRDEVQLYPQPRELSQYFAMAVDSVDGKWKYVDSFPNTADFYQIPYFLKAWERIKGKGSVKNITEVRDQLLALAGQKKP